MHGNFLNEDTENRIIRLIQSSFEKGHSIPEALGILSEDLLNTDACIPDDIRRLLSNGVYDYHELIKNENYMSALRTTFNLIYDFICDYAKNLKFKIEGRRKGAINSIEKMLRLINEGRPLDLFRDALGIRVIIFGEETEDLQQTAYCIINDIITFMLDRHFTLCEVDKFPKRVPLDKGVNIMIPKESLILPIYETGIKDYVFYPKSNGYQSLHTVFRARNKSFIEIQVRTEQMHLNAEYDLADHGLYKTSKYGDRLHSKIDFSKIHMPGFRDMGNGDIYDDIGLQTSLLTFYRTRDF